MAKILAKETWVSAEVCYVVGKEYEVTDEQARAFAQAGFCDRIDDKPTKPVKKQAETFDREPGERF